jgi:hypothetical protein
MERGHGQEVREYQAPQSFKGGQRVRPTSDRRAKDAALPKNSLVSLITAEATIHSIRPYVSLTMNLTAQLRAALSEVTAFGVAPTANGAALSVKTSPTVVSPL